MKHIPLLTTIFFILLTTAKAEVNDNNLIITATLVEEVTLPPVCGVVAHATVYKFEIYNADKTEQDINFLKVLIMCPGDYGESFFIAGKRYKLELSNTAPDFEEDILLDLYEKELLPLMYAVSVLSEDNH